MAKQRTNTQQQDTPAPGETTPESDELANTVDMSVLSPAAPEAAPETDIAGKTTGQTPDAQSDDAKALDAAEALARATAQAQIADVEAHDPTRQPGETTNAGPDAPFVEPAVEQEVALQGGTLTTEGVPTVAPTNATDAPDDGIIIDSDEVLAERARAEPMVMAARYLGNGVHFIDGIPAHDLSNYEWHALTAALRRKAIASSLYEKVL